MTGKWLLRIGCVIGLATGFSASAHALKDPTRPSGFQAPPQAATQQTVYALNSIMVGDNRRMAIINGQPVREGEALADARISSIHQDRVVLQINGATRVLHWTPPPSVRVTH